MTVSQYFRLSLITAALCTPIMSQSGTLGSGTSGINPGVIGGIEGGITNVDWPNVSGTMGANGGTLLSQTPIKRAFTGAIGFFAGYKFPISAHIAFEPMIGYHDLGTSHDDIYKTIRPSNTNSPIVNTTNTIQSKISTIDLTIQGIYRLENGINFFIQPGVAIVSNKLNIVDTLLPAVTNETNTSFRPEIALGLGKMVTDHLNVFAKYTFISGNDINAIFPTLTPNLGTIALGLSVEA